MLKPLQKLWIIGIVLLSLLVGCTLLFPPPVATSVHLLLGNPSQATANRSNADNYLLIKPQYVVSYNNSKHTPNWVSWQLNSTWLGNVRRRNDFRPDDSLPQGWYRVLPSDYSGSGFDRGHMAPSGDRTRDPETNSATFLMTNILPQSPDNNQGPWNELESYCRSLVQQGKELYIVAGGYSQKRVLAKGGIVAPAHTWKVIVVLDRVGAGIQGITNQTRVIAVDLPNVDGIKETDWRTYRVSVDAIEAAIRHDGYEYNFLSNVPEAIQTVLESKVDNR